MARKPYSVHTHRHFKVRAKDLKKNDRVMIFGYSVTVKSNKKNDSDGRVLYLETTYGRRREFLVIIGKRVKVDMSDRKFKSNPKNR